MWKMETTEEEKGVSYFKPKIYLCLIFIIINKILYLYYLVCVPVPALPNRYLGKVFLINY